jgi:hypothetical protein
VSAFKDSAWGSLPWLLAISSCHCTMHSRTAPEDVHLGYWQINSCHYSTVQKTNQQSMWVMMRVWTWAPGLNVKRTPLGPSDTWSPQQALLTKIVAIAAYKVQEWYNYLVCGAKRILPKRTLICYYYKKKTRPELFTNIILLQFQSEPSQKLMC